MKDIKELALKVAQDMGDDEGTDRWLIEFAQRLIAAYCAEQSPVSLYPCGFKELNSLVIKNGAYLARGMVEDEPVTESIRSAAMVLVGYAKDMSGLLARKPLYAAPPLTEPAPLDYWHQKDCDHLEQQMKPAPTVDPHWPKTNLNISEKSAATTPEEAQEMVSELLAITETINRGHHAADHYDAITISCAANLIERLAADVAKWQALTDDQAKLIEVITRRTEREDRLAALVPEGCVVVPKEPTEAMRAVIRNDHGAYGSEDALYSALIAAGEVK